MLPFLPAVKKLQDKLLSKFGFRSDPWPFFILGIVILGVAFLFISNIVSFAFSLSLFLAPVWLPFLLVSGAWTLWVVLKRSEFIAAQTNILLEIKPPRNLVKTPLAMEAFLSGMHHSPGEASWFKVYFGGSVRPWWSLEVASLEGQVHFYIWTRVAFRRLIEAQMYAQYPGVQIVEAVDYTRFVTAPSDVWGVWGCDYAHTAADPLPIKTYIEYGLDKVQKEPEQVDPLANLIEFMGSIGKGEYLWLQFVLRVHKGEKYHKKIRDEKGKLVTYTWKHLANELIQEIRKSTRDPYIDPVTGEERPGFPNPTKGQMEKIAAMERNVSKLAFDVGARAVYLARSESFNVSGIFGLIDLFKHFSSEGWNGIKATKWMMQFDDFPWEFGVENLKNKVRTALIEAYRRRQFFYDPFSHGLLRDDLMVMSTEELATVFHIPSASIETPSLGRIHSATGEAPGNLPT
ncbi:MAG: hypothetical protein Q8O94_04195 [bacterium]|nr:hypothetical protein [bacterium]